VSTLDLVVTNAIVVDGTSRAAASPGEVGLVGGLIAEVGDLSRRSRKETLDAGGKVLAPGFIDTHTHVEMASLGGHPDRFAPIAQGVTTTLVGADGFGWVGLRDDGRLRWWEDTAAIYGPPPNPLPVWSTPAEFISDLAASSLTEVLPMIPHNNVRAAVMGDSRKAASPAEMRAMHELVDSWLDAGAVGLATGLDYLPGRFAETDEIVELCERVAEAGGVYASHIRLLDAGRRGAWSEAAEIGRRAGCGVRIAHERLDEEGLSLLDEVSGGVDVTIDSYLYPAGCTSLAFHVPPEHLSAGVVALSNRLEHDADLAGRLATHLEGRLTAGEDKQVIVAGTTSGRHEGRTLGSLAEEWGSTVGEVAVDLLRDEMPCAVLIYAWQAPDVSWDAIVKRTLADSRTLVASDGVYVGSAPHPRGFGTFPRVLGALSREKGLISLPDAVHKMTGMPAAVYGLTDRGVIEPGRRADLVIFDPAMVDGASEYHQPRLPPTGIETVFIAGRLMKVSRDPKT
jgi:N-acyl-D-amino-acid deacylase